MAESLRPAKFAPCPLPESFEECVNSAFEEKFSHLDGVGRRDLPEFLGSLLDSLNGQQDRSTRTRLLNLCLSIANSSLIVAGESLPEDHRPKNVLERITAALDMGSIT